MINIFVQLIACEDKKLYDDYTVCHERLCPYEFSSSGGILINSLPRASSSDSVQIGVSN